MATHLRASDGAAFCYKMTGPLVDVTEDGIRACDCLSCLVMWRMGRGPPPEQGDSPGYAMLRKMGVVVASPLEPLARERAIQLLLSNKETP